MYREGEYKRLDIFFYYHTHGAWIHKNNDCRNPGSNHKRNTTFENKMNRSTAFCQFVKTLKTGTKGNNSFKIVADQLKTVLTYTLPPNLNVEIILSKRDSKSLKHYL